MAHEWDEILDHEHRMTEKVLEIVKAEADKLRNDQGNPKVVEQALDFFSVFTDGCHHQKEEKVLFPMLEARGVSKGGGPTEVMLAEHDRGRGLLAGMKESARTGDWQGFHDKTNEYVELMKGHIWKEDDVLYPAARKVLSADDRTSLAEGFERVEESVGEGTHERFAAMVHQLETQSGSIRPLIENVPMPLLDAMLDTLPFEITLVNDEDTVIYFNKEHQEKLFPRTRAAIGRKVQNCHPQKSAHLVSRILDDFRNGVRDSFEFWFDVGPRKAYVRYFAVRDESGKYLGCIGVDQDITDIQKLQGERRL